MALRLHNKGRYPYFFLLAAVAIFFTWICFEKADRPEILLSALGAVATFFYFVYKQHLDETRLFKELFIGFNGRYDTLNDELNRIVAGPLNVELSEIERDLVFSYFNLCGEEHFFYKAGYIDESVWQSWCGGMSLFFENLRIRRLWDIDCKSASYYGFRPPAPPIQSASRTLTSST